MNHHHTSFHHPSSMTQETNDNDGMIETESALNFEIKTATPDKHSQSNNIPQEEETNNHNNDLSSVVVVDLDGQVLEMKMDQRNYNDDERNRSNYNNQDDQRALEEEESSVNNSFLLHPQHSSEHTNSGQKKSSSESISVENGKVSFSSPTNSHKKRKTQNQKVKPINLGQTMESRVSNSNDDVEQLRNVSQIPTTPYYLRLYTLAREKQQRMKNVAVCDSPSSKKIPISRFVEMYERGMIQKKKNGQVLSSLQERSISYQETPKKLRSQETPSKKLQPQTPSYHKTPESKRSIYHHHHHHPKSSLQAALEKTEPSTKESNHKFVDKSTMINCEVSVFERLYCARKKCNEDTAFTTFDTQKKETFTFTPDISKSQSIVPSPYSGKNKRAHERLYENRLSIAAKKHEEKEAWNLKDKKQCTFQPSMNHNRDVNTSTNTKSLIDFLFRMPSQESPHYHPNTCFKENSYGITQPYYGNQPRHHNISESDSSGTTKTIQDDDDPIIISQDDPFVNNFDHILSPKTDISMVEEVGTGCQLIRVSSDLTLDSENSFE